MAVRAPGFNPFVALRETVTSEEAGLGDFFFSPIEERAETQKVYETVEPTDHNSCPRIMLNSFFRGSTSHWDCSVTVASLLYEI